jgi:hypothetical protein
MDRQAHHGQLNAPSRRRANKSKTHSQQGPASPESGLKATNNLPSTFAKARAFRKRRPKQTESSKTQPDNHRPAPSDSNPNPTDGQITIHSTTRDLGASQNESERLSNAESSKSPACLVLRIQGPSIPSFEALHQRQSASEKDKEASGSYRTRAPFDWRPKKFHSRAPVSTHLSHQPHTPQKRSKPSQVINADTAQISLPSQGNTNMGE